MGIIQDIVATTVGKEMINHSIFQAKYQELDVLVIKHPTCTAAVSLQGGHLLFWHPIAEKSPVIWLSENAFFKKATPIRGGVPICWPWFGKVREPMHGFARLVDWSLSSHTETTESVDLVLTLKNNEQTAQYFQQDFALTLHIHLGKTCEVTLSCLGDIEATTALHTYFAVSDIKQSSVIGLGPDYIERLPHENKPVKEGVMTFNQEVDRIYTHSNNSVEIKDDQRTIKITHKNHSDVVVWNPWIEKAKATADLTDDGYLDFVCVETCRVQKPIKSTSSMPATYGVKIEVIK